MVEDDPHSETANITKSLSESKWDNMLKVKVETKRNEAHLQKK